MIFHAILNRCFCAIISRELSVCADYYGLSNYTCESSMTRSVLAIYIYPSVCQDCSTPPTKVSPLERLCPRPSPNIAIVIQLPYFPTGLSPLSRPSFSTLPSWNIQTTSKPFMTLSMIQRPPLTHRSFLCTVMFRKLSTHLHRCKTGQKSSQRARPSPYKCPQIICDITKSWQSAPAAE